MKATEMFIKKLSDTELVDKYKFMEREIESRREMMGLGLSRDIEYKYQLLKEIKKRGLSVEYNGHLRAKCDKCECRIIE